MKDSASIDEGATTKELQIRAENESVAIFQRINKTMKRVRDANQAGELAQAMKTGFLGLGTAKKTDAIADAVVIANTALAEMNNLLQESIRFTCQSIQFAQVMYKKMAFMMVNGYKNTNGNITKLSKDSKKAVQLILNEADNFVKNQLAAEKKQVELEEKLDEKSKIDEEQNQRLEKLYAIFDQERTTVNNALAENDKIHKEQKERLFELKKILDEKSQMNEKQEKDIQLLLDYTKQKDELDKKQSENIEKLMEDLKITAAQRKNVLIFSIIAFAISISTLAFFILRMLGK
ncbi:hypothetical protein AGMMS49587_14260 [Spirochaetia bacterium]|nr:hypothetical protein AGMMS49587_14260 [Spirochaetia bacterium]